MSRIQGRWDIGYEWIDERTKEETPFLIVKDLKMIQQLVLRDEKQEPCESIQ